MPDNTMPDKQPMSVVLMWHMHQPEYRDLRTGAVHLPWTYLHAIKDYVDMAAHLEAVPEARAVVNFAPILLEQIEDYTEQITAYLEGHGAIRDPVLAELAEPALPGNEKARLRLMQDCLRANQERMIERFEPYKRLATMAEWYQTHPQSLIYASNQFLADLLVWYHLSWMAESVRRGDPRIQRLQDKACNFTLHERRELLHIVLEQMQSLVPRYRELAERGQVELCMSPYAHPIVPLLLDITSAREAMPDIHLPVTTEYPGGEARAQWHLQKGLESFERVFQRKPAGLWPSEGGVSQQALDLSDRQVTIPMKGMTQSLNVSVACAIVLYEAMRQREASGMYGERRISEELHETQRFEWAQPAVAKFCRQRNLDYPELDEEGNVVGTFPRR